MIYDALETLDVDLRDYRVPGYRGRSIHPRGVLEHHTASSAGSGDLPSLSTCIHGRPDLPGPLCQVLIGRAGTVAIITDGYANHAGSGKWPGITSGNDQLIGVELENNGVGESWSLGLLAVAAKVTARLCEVFSLGIVIGHKEWAQGRKIDPSFDMNLFRNAVTGIRAQPVFPPPTGLQEADMHFVRTTDTGRFYVVKLRDDGTWFKRHLQAEWAGLGQPAGLLYTATQGEVDVFPDA